MSAAIAIGRPASGLLPGSKPGVLALVPGRSAGLRLHGRIAGRKIGRGGAPLAPLHSKQNRSSSASGRASSLAVRSLFGGGGKPSEDVTYTLKGPRTVKLSGEPQVIGARRGPGVDVVLPLTGVSGVHCKIEPVRGGIKVTDLGSTNGTTINGREIKSSVLKAGQSLGLGTGKFELVEQKAPAPAAANGAAPSRRTKQKAKPAPAVKTKVVSAGKQGRYKTVLVKASQKEETKKPAEESSGGGLFANVFGAKKEKVPVKASAAKKPVQKPKALGKRKSTPPPKSTKQTAAKKSSPPASKGETPWGALAVGTAFAGVVADVFTSGSTAISAGGVLAAFVIAALGSTPSGTKAKEGKAAESSSKIGAKEITNPSSEPAEAAAAAEARSAPSGLEEPKATKELIGAAAEEVLERAVQSPPAAVGDETAAPAPATEDEAEKPASAVPGATISLSADDSAAKSGVEAIEALAAEVEAAAAAEATKAAAPEASEAMEAEANAAAAAAAAKAKEAAEVETAKVASREVEAVPAAEAAYKRIFTKEDAAGAIALGVAASAAAAAPAQSARSPAARAEISVSQPQRGVPHSAAPLMASGSSAKGRILSAGCGKVEQDAVLKASIINSFSLIVTFLSLLGTAAAAAAGYLVFFKEMNLSVVTTGAEEFARSLWSTLPGKLCAAAAALFLMVILVVMQKRDTTRLGWSA